MYPHQGRCTGSVVALSASLSKRLTWKVSMWLSVHSQRSVAIIIANQMWTALPKLQMPLSLVSTYALHHKLVNKQKLTMWKSVFTALSTRLSKRWKKLWKGCLIRIWRKGCWWSGYQWTFRVSKVELSVDLWLSTVRLPVTLKSVLSVMVSLSMMVNSQAETL